MSHVFVSYSRRDQEFVDRLAGDLERGGFNTWIDREDITGGAAWEANITRAVRDSAALVVVLSPASVGSEYVPRELSLADKFDRPVIPLLLAPWEDAAESERARRLEFQLAGLQHVDFARQPFEAGLRDLLRALRREEHPAQDVGRPSPARPTRRWLALAALALVLTGLSVRLATRGRAPAHVVAGSWRADVVYSWGARATEHFRFSLDGEAVSGTASFLGAPRGLLDGAVKDGRVTFRTRIEAGPGSPAFWNTYRGRVEGDRIHFLLQDDRGSPPLEFAAEREP